MPSKPLTAAQVQRGEVALDARGRVRAKRARRDAPKGRRAPPAAEGAVVAVLPRALTVTLALRLASEANERGWSIARAARTRRQRDATAAALRAALGDPPRELPLVVVITRIAPRALDSDNAVGSAKHVRDSVSQWIGIDDGDPRVRWVVEQERPAKGGPSHAVRIALHPGAGACAACSGRGWQAKRAGR
jgi:hypothetical protein